MLKITKLLQILCILQGRLPPQLIDRIFVNMHAQQKPNFCFSTQLGYCSCVTILPMLIQIMWPICY